MTFGYGVDAIATVPKNQWVVQTSASHVESSVGGRVWELENANGRHRSAAEQIIVGV
ncbi:hypothetical protein [Rhizobium jaguaris]|uniref:hypothetical protein n=1 Tax=Rhizobium jaguaris TaxID=1312183 RepID=UPI0013C43D36|nr:hypothetical protein [Rhizobium jaguaris]